MHGCVCMQPICLHSHHAADPLLMCTAGCQTPRWLSLSNLHVRLASSPIRIRMLPPLAHLHPLVCAAGCLVRRPRVSILRCRVGRGLATACRAVLLERAQSSAGSFACTIRGSAAVCPVPGAGCWLIPRDARRYPFTTRSAGAGGLHRFEAASPVSEPRRRFAHDGPFGLARLQRKRRYMVHPHLHGRDAAQGGPVVFAPALARRPEQTRAVRRLAVRVPSPRLGSHRCLLWAALDPRPA